MRTLYTLWPFFAKQKGRLLAGIAFVVISNFFAVLAPQLTGYIIDVAIKHSAPAKATSYNFLVQMVIRHIEHLDKSRLVMYASLSILSVALLKGFFMYWMRQTLVVMSRHIEYDLKKSLFDKYLSLDIAFHQKHSLGDMMSRISEDVSRIRMLAGPAIMYIFNIIATASLSIYYMMYRSPSLTLYVLLPLPLLAFLIYRVRSVIYAKNNSTQTALSDITGFARNVYAGVRIVKSFHQEKTVMEKFDQKNNDYRNKNTSLSLTESIFMPSISGIMGTVLVINLFVGGMGVIQNQLSIGVLTEFVIYLNMLVFPFTAIGWVSTLIQRGIVSIDRVNAFLQIKPSMRTEGKVISLDGSITMKDVSFTYTDKNVAALKHVSFNIPAGGKIGVVGMIGSGKTTLFNLLLRYYTPNEGSILLNNTPIEDMEVGSVRKQIAYVPQDPFLFSGSIIENLRIGNPTLSATEMNELLRAMDLEKDIQTFPQQEETFIGEKGITLSGGQKQRLSIARALAVKAPILLMDDCFSAIDTHTEEAILEYINHHSLAKTMIIASHRYTIMPSLDYIIVLHGGEIVETGTHDDLIQKQGHYYHLYTGSTLHTGSQTTS